MCNCNRKRIHRNTLAKDPEIQFQVETCRIEDFLLAPA